MTHFIIDKKFFLFTFCENEIALPCILEVMLSVRVVSSLTLVLCSWLVAVESSSFHANGRGRLGENCGPNKERGSILIYIYCHLLPIHYSFKCLNEFTNNHKIA